MSLLKFTKVATPATPATNKSTVFVDTTTRRASQIDDNGVISELANNGITGINIVDNGAFRVQQRQVAASTAIAGVSTTTRAGQVADRWAVTTSVATNLNWQQVDTAGTQDTGLQARYYGSIISSTAGKKVMLSHVVLSSDMSRLRGKKCRVSIKHNQKVGTGQTYRMGVLQLTNAGTVDTMPAFLTGAWSTTTGVDPVWGTNLSSITPDASPVGENCTVGATWATITSVATTWTKSSAVFTIPTSAKNLVFVFFSDATGGTTDNISVAEVMITSGTEVVDFAELPLSVELVRCQRFFSKSFPYGTLPAASLTVASAGTGASSIIGKAAATALAVHIPIIFPVRMWKTPVVTLYTPVSAGAVPMRIDGTTPAVQTAVAQLGLTDIGLQVTATGDALGAVGDLVGVHWSAEADFIT